MEHPLDGSLVDPHDDQVGSLEHVDEAHMSTMITLSTLLGTDDVEQALSNLTPTQLIQLEKNLQKRKKQIVTPTKPRKMSVPKSPRSGENGDPNAMAFNLPYASPTTPIVDVRDGVEWITFHYTNKGRIQEYTIRIDSENVTLEEIPDDFKRENCVYPRAFCDPGQYEGNRWEYETNCNEIAWKLTWLNPSILSGRRGLIQRAVDSFRNRFDETRSRRVQRQEKLTNGTLRRRLVDHPAAAEVMRPRGPRMLTFHWLAKGITSKTRIRVDVENADMNDMDEGFKRANSVFPRAMEEKETQSPIKWEYENRSNEIGWKLAWLNMNKLGGKRAVLLKAVEAYRNKFDDANQRKLKSMYQQELYVETLMNSPSKKVKSEDFSVIVANTLQQAMTQNMSPEEVAAAVSAHAEALHHFGHAAHFAHHEGDLDLEPQTMSTADLLSNMS